MRRFISLSDSPLPAIVLGFGFSVWGLCWGLPSLQRRDLLLKPELQTPEFYRKIADARDTYYNQIGNNPVAYYGRSRREHVTKRLESTSLLSVYSSFLIRTHQGDEAATLTMISHLNPLKGKWYPHMFVYGGPYIYPLAVYLGIMKVLHLVTLVPDTAYYYAHPDRMAAIYVAARTWTVLGMLLATGILFYLGRRLGGPFVGTLGSCFFALSPACIVNAKLAKPHPWSTAWTLAMIYYCVISRDDTRLRRVVLAGALFGLAVGTTTNQVAFLPFLLWACWTPSFRRTLLRLIVAGATSAGVYLITNFYLLAHLQDFMDETYFNSHYYPFAFRFPALGEFLTGAMRVSFGTVLWAVALAGVVWACIQKRSSLIRSTVFLSLVVFVYIAFQLQSEHGSPMNSRFILTLVGLWSLYAAGWIKSLPRKAALVAGCLVSLGVMGTLYNLHYTSDQAPRDNASLAALWIHEHAPAGSVIGQGHAIPHTTDFPPIDFARYSVVPFDSPEFRNAKPPVYAVIPLWLIDREVESRQLLKTQGFSMAQRFAESPLQKLGYGDAFTSSNVPLEIYERSR